ncbi:MAG TPA: MG2 domain-containing protein, partial [Polyangiaceae bacterium]|nr:MG2 domain-containing protein [Polyangiaceae bacterium]
MSKLRPAPFTLIVMVAAVSCFHGEKAPTVTPNHTLSLAQLENAHISDQPFGVVFGAPQGETTDAAEVSLVFNRPMRPLGLAGEEAPSPAKISPEIPGAWRWIGTHGLYFAPEGHLPKATDFIVTVPQGTRCLDGSTLPSAYELRFSTQRPQLVSTTPWNGSTGLTPAAHFALQFNQPIADNELRRAIKITALAKGTPIPFEVRRPDTDNPKLAELVPTRPLPLAAKIQLTVDASIKGIEGPLTANAPAFFEYETYGPLQVAETYCPKDTPKGKCAPRNSVSIGFTNPVAYAEAKKAISVTPALPLKWWEGAGDDYETERIQIDGAFRPAGTYTIRINGNLRDKYGQRLGRDQVIQLEFDDLWPQAEIGVRGTYFEPTSTRDIAVASVNVPSMDLLTVKVDDDGLRLLSSATRPSFEQLSKLAGSKLTRVHPAAAPNLTAKQIVRPADVLGGSAKRGPMVVGIRYMSRPGTPNARNQEAYQVVQVTDLGISAKVSRFGSLVWINRLSDGKPVEGAEVRIRTPGTAASSDFVVRTDAHGMALVDGSKLFPAKGQEGSSLILVKHGDDWAYRNASDIISTWRYDVPSNLYGEMSPYGMVFTERGVYRPGDTVKIKGIFRQPEARGTSTPVGKSTKITVSTPDGDDLLSRDATLSEFGTLALEFKIPATAELGYYSIGANVGGTDAVHAWGSFNVAEYRASEFKVTTDLNRRSYIRGDEVRCSAQGDYLFGAPMSGSELRTTITRGPSWFAVPKTDDFITTDHAFEQDREEGYIDSSQLLATQGKLDAQGKSEAGTKLELPGMRGTEYVNCEVEVTDLSRQTVASFSHATVHPAAFYLALQTGNEGFAQSGTEIGPQILAVDPEGRRQSGVAVDIELIRRTWVTARESAGTNGYHSVSRAVDTVVSQCSTRTVATPASCNLKVPTAGYFILRAKAKDARGNPVAASTYLYATGSGESGWAEHDDMRVELVPDKTSYEVGQTARILVKSPFQNAEALVTVERAGIYSHRRMQLHGSMPTLSIPITADFHPNAYVSVVLLRGRSKTAPAQWNAPDVGAPAFRIGYANLQINPESKRLNVEVNANKKDYRPGEQVAVDLQIRDRAGKGQRAEVTLYAVDEGVLMLTDYKTPDPIPIFTEPHPLRVGFTEARTDLARLTLSPFASTVGEDKGLDGGGGGAARSDFRQSVYFNPSLITDESGKAKATFKLPDSLTSYRIMAVVVGATDQFGFGQSTVTTSLPLLARPAFPRVLRAGDEIDAGVVLTSKTLPKSAIDVKATVQGLELVGESVRQVELDKGQSREVRFRFRANSVGNAKVRFHVQGGGEQDSVEITKAVRAPTSLESVALYGSTRSATGEMLGDLSAIRTDVGSINVSVASTALVGLAGSVEYLTEYPYECTEQLASRLVPLIPLRELARLYSLPLPKNTDAFITNTVTKLVRRQRYDGGFGLWDESRTSHPWVSAYALWSLYHAKKAGASVPKKTIENGRTYLRRYLDDYETASHGLTTAAFVMDILAEMGVSDPGYMNRLFDQRADLPLFAKAYLAHAMAMGGGDEKGRDELIRDIEGHIRVQGNQALVTENLGDAYAELMDSTTRTNALVLRALLSVKKNHALAEPMTRGLLGARQQGTWRNTQEAAYALLALDEYRKAQEFEEPDFTATVWLGDEQILQQAMTGRSVKSTETILPASRMVKAGGNTLAFQRGGNGKGTLHYEARLRYARKQLPKEPIDRGFFVQKAMRVVTPESLASSIRSVPSGMDRFPSPRGGELVLVDLLVVAPQPHDYVIIEDPIPAGLEAIDASLATTAGSLAIAGFGGEDDALDDIPSPREQ